ncbi:lipase class 3 [Fusarium albosuccineum]|uniref:Lipase class 3 n=1 Tax=Fusarium albosuccineum TaxID=1237068 RepID=A0A8H4LLD8_9HYPO|nr:lipase class 3 [Fusarium albosuccineum]
MGSQPPPSVADLKDQFAQDNLERLSNVELPSQPTTPGIGSCEIVLDVLKSWSNDNKANIQQAIDAQVFGGKGDINWSNAFLPFMESVGVYLRDWGTILEATKAYQEFKDSGSKDDTKRLKALSLYHSAHEQIEELAQLWGMHFYNICELVIVSPDGHPSWDGPFCGAFAPINKQTEKPFIGVAFKGTNPFQLREDFVDFNYQLMEAGEELDFQPVSTGVYTGLFDKFGSMTETPFESIRAKLNLLAKAFQPASASTTQPRVHVTGHSLGGSYSSLCYAALIAAGPGLIPTSFAMGDEYTFGSPRVGSKEWAEWNNGQVGRSEGQSWRIVLNTDIVPQVPPTVLKPDQTNFYHVDQGVRIFKDSPPQLIPSEVDGPPPTPFNITNLIELIKFVGDSTEHCKR